MENDNLISIKGYELEFYRNDDNDIVISQPDYMAGESIIIIGKEQIPAVIRALKTLPLLV